MYADSLLKSRALETDWTCMVWYDVPAVSSQGRMADLRQPEGTVMLDGSLLPRILLDTG